MTRVSREIGGLSFIIEAGRLARQADGAVWVQYGDTAVLVTVVSDRVREGIDFLPLTVDYQEMAYAAGKIPGGFFKREGRSTDQEILVSRLIDRPIRPLFPKGYNWEIQIIATVMSAEMEHLPDILALNGASCALMISDVPFDGPVGAVRIGRINGQWVLNPGEKQLEESDIDIVVAGTRDAIVMVEGEAKIVREEELLEGLFLAHQALQPLLDMQEELREAVGLPKRQFTPPEIPEELKERIRGLWTSALDEALRIPRKKERRSRIAEIHQEAVEALSEEFPDHLWAVRGVLEDLEREIARRMILVEGRRIDGRAFDEVRPVSCAIGLLPRAHGSGLFTRGETQVMAATTLGTTADEQRLDTLSEEELTKSFILHYRFPPFCVGETKPLRAPSRREIGHGALAERALKPVLPNAEEFPYTIRVVTEVLESNGSSSMASTCGATLALMDAGVPIRAAVAGVAMGLIKEGDQVAILTDILGDEDHLGDMDFKVTGTKDGITALQMDIKTKGITKEILQRALEQARRARLWILERMLSVIPEPRKELSPYAPRIVTLQVKPEKIKDIIGPGGRMIRRIIEETGVKIEVEDDGKVHIASSSVERKEKAKELIQQLTEEAEVGGIYMGKVKRVMDFGAIVELFPGTDGLLHISQLDNARIRSVTDVIKEGDQVLVKVLEIDDHGKIRLSRKAALEEQAKSNASGQRPAPAQDQGGERRRPREAQPRRTPHSRHGRKDPHKYRR
jgi:polyribonucleotide nucleotidyltransferase